MRHLRLWTHLFIGLLTTTALASARLNELLEEYPCTDKLIVERWRHLWDRDPAQAYFDFATQAIFLQSEAGAGRSECGECVLSVNWNKAKTNADTKGLIEDKIRNAYKKLQLPPEDLLLTVTTPSQSLKDGAMTTYALIDLAGSPADRFLLSVLFFKNFSDDLTSSSIQTFTRRRN